MIVYLGYDDSATTHLSLLKSPWLMDRVVHDYQMECMIWTAQKPDITAAILAGLTVTDEKGDEDVRSDSHVFKLACQTPCADDCPTILNALIESYQKVLEENARNVNEDALTLITQTADKVRQELQQKETEYEAFRAETPLLLNGKRTPISRELGWPISSRRPWRSGSVAELESRPATLARSLQVPQDAVAVEAMIPAITDATRARASRRCCCRCCWKRKNCWRTSDRGIQRSNPCAIRSDSRANGSRLLLKSSAHS